MKFVDKKNLLIRERNEKGEFDFEYNPNVIFNSDKYADYEVVNIKTKEKLLYKDLVLAISNKDGGYFYPPEMYGTTKVISEYKVKNWLFVNDSRSQAIQDSDFKENVIQFMEYITTLLETISKSSDAVKVASDNTIDVINNTIGVRDVARPFPQSTLKILK